MTYAFGFLAGVVITLIVLLIWATLGKNNNNDHFAALDEHWEKRHKLSGECNKHLAKIAEFCDKLEKE